MIFDRIENSHFYEKMHPHFQTAFKFIREGHFEDLDQNLKEVKNQPFRAMLVSAEGKGHENVYLENHLKFLDFHYIISGTDEIGYTNLHQCKQIKQAYDKNRDLGFFADQPTFWLKMNPGEFAIFFPQDCHAPLAGEVMVKKIVIKIPC
jgi:YhcH/YjgK/YiaL family protein